MGLLGGSCWRAQARVLQRQRASVLAEWVTHPARVSKITELRQPFHREKATRRSSNEAEKAKPHDDVEATALRQHDAQGDLGCGGLANAVPHSDIRDCRLQQAWQRVDVYVGAPRRSSAPATLACMLLPPPIPQARSRMDLRTVAQRTARSVIVTNMSMTRTATVTSSMRSGARANVFGGRVRGKAACETRKEERV